MARISLFFISTVLILAYFFIYMTVKFPNYFNQFGSNERTKIILNKISHTTLELRRKETYQKLDTISRAVQLLHITKIKSFIIDINQSFFLIGCLKIINGRLTKEISFKNFYLESDCFFRYFCNRLGNYWKLEVGRFHCEYRSNDKNFFLLLS